MSYDLVIVGGGMVGASLAIALSSSSRIALIDAGIQSEDARLIALNHRSYSFFEKLGVWSKLISHAAPIEEVHVSFRKHFGITRLRADQMNLSALGYVVPAKYINHALNEKLNSCDVTVIKPAKLKNIIQQEKNILLEIENHADISTKYLIGADGTHSTVRELMKFKTDVLDYHQSALVTVTELSRSHYSVAYERFHEHGAIAMLPLKENRVATIWSDTAENISVLKALSDEEFLIQLQKSFGYRLGKLQKINQRFVFPLKKYYVENPFKDNVLLIGNAAHTLHPIAAQGLNLALQEIDVLMQCYPDFEKFISEMKNKIERAMNLSHRLTEIFAMDFFGMSLARSLMMLGLDVSGKAKEYFFREVV